MGLFDKSGGGERSGYGNLLGCYERGAPYEGISEDDAVRWHDQVARLLSHDEYQRAATDAIAAMPGGERLELGDYLRQAEARGKFAHRELREADDSRLADPHFLGTVLGSLHNQDPDLLRIVLAGDEQPITRQTDDYLNQPITGAAARAVDGKVAGMGGLSGTLKIGVLAGIAAHGGTCI
jgi:hypothetical protein